MGCASSKQDAVTVTIDRKAPTVASAEVLLAEITPILEAIGGEGNRKVFRDLKRYGPAWKLVEGTAEADMIEQWGMALEAAVDKVQKLLAAFLVNPANQVTHEVAGQQPMLHQAEAAAAREIVLEQLRKCQTLAEPLIEIVNTLGERAFEALPGSLAPIATSKSAATQPIAACFEGVITNVPVPMDEWTAEVLETVKQAVAMTKSGQHQAEDVHVDPKDDVWLMVRDAISDKEIAPMEFMFAQMLLLSPAFHRDMEALLGRFGEYKAARMKSSDRCHAKTDAIGGDYSRAKLLADDGIEMQEPNCRYLKDVLRCTLLLDKHEDLGKAHEALVAKYEPVTTKDRRQELPRDVLQTVWYEGVIVEVQFHFKAVVALKAFSHVAYNITRVPTETLVPVRGTLFDFPSIHLEKYTAENVVTSRLHF